jgi:16S rRNA (guanine527-N7)-methyltransferase
MERTAQDRLITGLAELGVTVDRQTTESLVRFADEIALWNPRIGLVAAEGETLVIRHFLDSLAGLRYIRGLKPRRLADIGSGGGFPGIPLALFLPETAITLVERSGKRAGFLRNATLILGLRHVTVVEAPMEEISGDYDVVTLRAFSPIDVSLIKSLSRLLESGGRIVAYKGKRERLDDELEAVSGEIVTKEIYGIAVPGLDEERNLAVLTLNPRRLGP